MGCPLPDCSPLLLGAPGTFDYSPNKSSNRNGAGCAEYLQFSSVSLAVASSGLLFSCFATPDALIRTL